MKAVRFGTLVLVAVLVTFWPAVGLLAQEESGQATKNEEVTPEQQAAMEEMLARDTQFLGEIVVTAQKQEESVNDVSATVVAFTGDDLRELGIGTAFEMDRLVSNTDIKTSVQGANPAFTIRGVGMNNFNSNNNPSVGVNVNEIALSSPAMLSLFMMDVARTEVVKGPQGTLYGRNTNGGAINIHSNKPSQTGKHYGRVGYGAYNTFDLEGVVNGGLSDAWAGRLSFMYNTQGDSFYDNLLTGENMGSFDQAGLRGQLRYDKGGPFSMNFSLSYLDQSGVSGMKEIYTTNDPNDTFSLCPEAAAAMAAGDGANIRQFPRGGCVSTVGTYDSDPDQFKSDIDPNLVDRLKLDTNVLAGVFNFDYEFSGATLSSITGYITQDRLYGEGAIIPGDLFFVQHDEEIWQVSQELRLSGNSDKLDWIVGAFYSHDQIEAFNPLQSAGIFGEFFGLNPLYWDYDQKTTAAALFGNIDWHLSNKVTLSAGLRYTDETISFVGGTSAFEVGGPLETTDDVLNAPREVLDDFSFPLTYIDDEINDSKPSGRVALEWRPNDKNLIYGSVSSGFKSGGFYGDFTIEQYELDPFKPETVLAYEIGGKSTMAGGNIQLNGAVFLYDYEDIQTFVPATVGFRFANLEKAKITGLDVELIARPVKGLDILIGAGWLDTSIDSEFSEWDGNELPNAPKYQFNGLIRYMFPASSKIWLAPMVGFKTSDAKFTEATNNPFNYAPRWSVFDFRFGIQPANLRWEIAVWAQNFTDERYFEEVFYSDVLGTIDAINGSPNTWGLSFTYNF